MIVATQLFRRMKMGRVFALAMCAVIVGVACAALDSAPQSDAAAPLGLDELKKLRIPELKKFLAARGQTCDGCAEKDDYVQLALYV